MSVSKNFYRTASFIFAGGLTVLSGQTALAQSDAMELSLAPQLPRYAVQQLKRNPTQFLRNQIAQLYRVTPTGIVTKKLYDEYSNHLKMKQRGRLIGGFLFMDLDGDFEISASERDTALKFEPSSLKSRYTLLFLEGDKDNDGNISRKELIAYVDESAKRRRRPPARGIDIFIFDVNEDGTVTPEEIKAYVDTNRRN